MSYEPSLYNMVPKRKEKSNAVTIALVVVLLGCLGCAGIAGIGGIIAARSVGEVLPTIQAGVAATLTATAGPQGYRAANNRAAPSVPPTSTPNTTPRPRPTDSGAPTAAPTATARATRTATTVRPTSTPLPKPQVSLQNVGYFRDSWGDLYFMGELINTGALDAGDFLITVTLLGERDQVVAEAELDGDTLGVAILKPGRKTVWNLKLSGAPRQWQRERIEATTGPVVAGRGQSPYSELRTEGVQLSGPTKPFNKVVASGQVQNTGLTGVRDARARLAIYDGAGKLIGVYEGWPKFAEVPAGGVVPFTVEFPELQQTPASYELYFTNLR